MKGLAVQTLRWSKCNWPPAGLCYEWSVPLNSNHMPCKLTRIVCACVSVMDKLIHFCNIFLSLSYAIFETCTQTHPHIHPLKLSYIQVIYLQLSECDPPPDTQHISFSLWAPVEMPSLLPSPLIMVCIFHDRRNVNESKTNPPQSQGEHTQW